MYAIASTPERVARFWSRVEQGDAVDCWPWTRARSGNGYGVLRYGSGGVSYTLMAHRVAWMLHHRRDIPDGLVVDHLCKTRACCNPRHLELVTQSENVRRSDKHLAGRSRVVRVGPKTVRVQGGRRMEIWREYLADGRVRQAGRTLKAVGMPTDKRS